MKRYLYLFLTFLFVGNSLSYGQGQTQDATAFADTKLYDAVVDQAFRHDFSVGSSEIQLRYTYCDAGELQIVIGKQENTKFDLQVWYVRSGTPNLWNQLATLVSSNPNIDAASAASKLNISRKTLTISNSDKLAELIDRSNSLSVRLLRPSTITLDGTAYSVEVRSVAEDLSVTLQGPQDSGQSDSSLIRWMGEVRANIEPMLKGR